MGTRKDNSYKFLNQFQTLLHRKPTERLFPAMKWTEPIYEYPEFWFTSSCSHRIRRRQNAVFRYFRRFRMFYVKSMEETGGNEPRTSLRTVQHSRILCIWSYIELTVQMLMYCDLQIQQFTLCMIIFLNKIQNLNNF